MVRARDDPLPEPLTQPGRPGPRRTVVVGSGGGDAVAGPGRWGGEGRRAARDGAGPAGTASQRGPRPAVASALPPRTGGDSGAIASGPGQPRPHGDVLPEDRPDSGQQDNRGT